MSTEQDARLIELTNRVRNDGWIIYFDGEDDYIVQPAHPRESRAVVRIEPEEVMPFSYKAEVKADETDLWCSNALRFATKLEAEQYVTDLASRWLAVREVRVTGSDERPNYKFIGGQVEAC